MNWIDYTVAGILAVFAVVGLIKGFVLSIFKIASFFIAIFASIRFSPRVSDFLGETALAGNIRNTILDNLKNRYEAVFPKAGEAGSQAVDRIMEELAVPAFFKEGITGRLPKPEEIVDVQGILESISNELTAVIISVAGLVIVFILARLGLFVIGVMLKGLVNLPVLKQFNRIGGLAFGLVEGLLVVYFLFAILFLFSSSPLLQNVFSDLEASLIAKGFYRNNILIDWIYSKTV